MNLNQTLNHFKLLTPTRAFTERIMSFDSGVSVLHARLVYSLLAHRARIDLGASNNSIREEIGLHLTSISKTIKSLGDLVIRRGNEWIALEPPEGTFVKATLKEQPDHWGDRLAYMMLYLPKKGATIEYPKTKRRFNLNHAIIWSFLVSNSKKGVVRDFTFAGAGKMFGLDPKTVASIVDDFVWLKLISREDLGRSSHITLLPNNDSISALFQQKSKPPEKTTVEPVEKLPRPAPASYQFKNDIWDLGRRACQSLMPQTICEEIIAKAIRLGDAAEDFPSAVTNAKKRHDDNISSGKVTKGDFGKYFMAFFDNRIAVVEEQKKKAEEERQRAEYFDSDEFKLKQKKLDQDAAADPMHPRHFVNDQSILDRVQIKGKWSDVAAVYDFQSSVRMHITVYVRSTGKRLWIEDENNLVGAIHSKIMKPALAALNVHYLKEQRATVDDLKREIDIAIAKHVPTMPLMFSATNSPAGQPPHNPKPTVDNQSSVELSG